jgi:copper homeostasis protein
MIMIRPRPGDFRYAEHELDCMLRDIELVKREGVYGVVLGALRGDGGIDYQATGRLIAAARPMSVTFHRAFDRTTDPHRALEQLMDLGCDRVLTSGQKPSAEEGILLLAELERQAIGQIVVMAGGGVTEKNALRILQATGVKEIHFSAREPTKVAAGDTARIEFSAADVNALWETSQQRVESIRSVVSRK